MRIELTKGMKKKRWRKLLTAWQQELDALWTGLHHGEAVWAWGEQTNTGILAAAAGRAFAGNCLWMVETTLLRGANEDRRGRYDLWFQRNKPQWKVHMEAKHQWSAEMSRQNLRKMRTKLSKAVDQAADLARFDWTDEVVVVDFLVPNPRWDRFADVPARFERFEDLVWEELQLAGGEAFLASFSVCAEELKPLCAVGGNDGAFPGVVLAGLLVKGGRKGARRVRPGAVW